MKAARGNVAGFHEEPLQRPQQARAARVPEHDSRPPGRRRPRTAGSLDFKSRSRIERNSSGSGLRVSRKVAVVGFQNTRGQRRRKQVAHDAHGLHLRIDAKSRLEKMTAVNREQDQRLRNALAERAGKLARLAVYRRAAQRLPSSRSSAGIVFAKHHARHREITRSSRRASPRPRWRRASQSSKSRHDRSPIDQTGASFSCAKLWHSFSSSS